MELLHLAILVFALAVFIYVPNSGSKRKDKGKLLSIEAIPCDVSHYRILFIFENEKLILKSYDDDRDKGYCSSKAENWFKGRNAQFPLPRKKVSNISTATITDIDALKCELESIKNRYDITVGIGTSICKLEIEQKKELPEPSELTQLVVEASKRGDTKEVDRLLNSRMIYDTH